ncbi:MAG: molybdopterin-containing oxidoreductase family protein [Vicinamibacterales bacterium]
MTPIDRRRFLKVTAITGATAALSACGNPENQIIRFIPEEELIPGVSVWKRSICPLCQAGCGVIARVVEGEAEVFRNGQAGVIKMGLVKKLEGDPEDPISRGKLCPRGQAALQVTYHPDRIAAPLKRSGPRGSGQYQEISWDQALTELIAQLDALAAANDQQSLAFLVRRSSGRRPELIAHFLQGFGAPPAVELDVFGDAVLRHANRLSFGREQLPTVDFGASRFVVAFGADFLGTWNSPVAHSGRFGAMRQGRAGVRAKFVQVEPRMSLTGASADEWIPATPGTEGVLALGLAHAIMKAGLRSAAAAGRAGTLVEGWSQGLPAYSPDLVERKTGVNATTIERLAREFASSGPAVALIGDAPLAYTNGLFQAIAVNALNALVGSVGAPGGIEFVSLAADARLSHRSLTSSVRGLSPFTQGPLTQSSFALSPPKILILDDANVAYAAPPAWKVREFLQQVPFIASFGSFLDDTSVHADLILPDHSFLESMVDAQPESGSIAATYRSAEPAMRPLHNTRSTPDVLIEIARKLQKPVALPWPSWEEGVKARGAGRAGRAGEAGQPGRGGSLDPPTAGASKDVPLPATVDATFDGDPSQYEFHFIPYKSQALLDGSLAHLPWLQEMPDPLTSAMWSSWIEINPQTAARLGIGDGDLVEVTSAHGTLRSPAILSPGVAPNVIAMPMGQGHEHFTRYASGRGANPISILAPVTELQTGALAWAATRVRVTRVGNNDGSLILFAGATRERPEGGR